MLAGQMPDDEDEVFGIESLELVPEEYNAFMRRQQMMLADTERRAASRPSAAREVIIVNHQIHEDGAVTREVRRPPAFREVLSNNHVIEREAPSGTPHGSKGTHAWPGSCSGGGGAAAAAAA